MFGKITLDKKIFFLSIIDNKEQIKASFEFLTKKGIVNKIFGGGMVLTDIFLSDSLDKSIKIEMQERVGPATVNWLLETCERKKINNSWDCFYYNRKVVGAIKIDFYNKYFYVIRDLDKSLIKNFLYKDSNFISVNTDILFNTNYSSSEGVLSRAVKPLKKSNSNKRILDKQINLLIGPSGSGKTSCALSNCKESDRIISLIGDSALSNVQPALDLFDPEVIILDDIELSAFMNSNKIIKVIDQIRATRTKLFITVMADHYFEAAPGSLYLPGLRPGRVDQMIYFEDMSDNEKLELLKKHSIENIDISKTKLFTYAYILELIRLIKEENKSFEEATKYLSLFIPIPSDEREEKINGIS